MSIRYKFLGRPKTLEEFIDKAKKWAVTPVDILVQGTGEGFDYYCSVKVLAGAGKIKLKLADFWEGSFPLGRIEAEMEALKKALKVAEELRGSGFLVTINNGVVKDAEVALVRYEEICRRYSQVRGKIFL